MGETTRDTGDATEAFHLVSETYRNVGCAGINRQEERDENARHRRSSDPRWPRVMRWYP